MFHIGDKNALILATRKSGYGSDYDVTVTCPKCQKKVKFNYITVKNHQIPY
jgi:hypothetical protein